MDHLLFIETGVGVDVHGQDVTTAAVRAVIDAIHKNSMPGITDILPDHDLNNMKVNIRLAVPLDKAALDLDRVKAEIPYGTVTVDVMDGGMAAPSGIFLRDKNDKNDLMYIVNVSVEVGY
ncbi:Lin0512 family protein [Sporolactobacillus pectinivorans]|uniref:Lin0512 family protein n=1 Tax=Sporolactobacillus pectinivorans TaxID=1591408 RepID=UPI000C25A890|nr:Lin0512 family protein [Sporolactobacillus pectinivorans]